MSSNDCTADQGFRAHQCVHRTSMQAAKLSEDAVSIGLVLVLARLARVLASNMFPLWLQKQNIVALHLVPPLLLVALVMIQIRQRWNWKAPVLIAVALALPARLDTSGNMDVLLEVLLVVVVLTFLLTLERVVDLWRARLHGRGSKLVKLGPHEWVLDSGAWIHCTSNPQVVLEGLRFQEIANQRVQLGSVRTEHFEFPGVRYVADDDDNARNVVSVSQLARDHGLVTIFEPTCCHVKDKKTGQPVGKGRLRNGMYMLDSLRLVGQHIRDGGASGGNRHDGAHGGGGGNGDGDSTAEGRGGGGRDGRGGGGTGARNQEESSGSGAAGGDVNEINEEEDSGKGEKEDDEKRGGQNSGQLSSRSHTGLFGMSRLDCIWWIVSILCIAACILQPYTGWGAGVTILPVDFHSLVAGFWVLFILSFQPFKTWMSTICKEEETLGPYLQELSHQEHNKRLFGLSRFDATTDPTGYHLPAGAFPASSTNAAAARREEFLVDSGASFHMTWNDWILIPYLEDLKDRTKPPTRRFGGIAAGYLAVTRSGYLSIDKIKLDGVLLTPDSRLNLVSVGQLSIQYEVKVEMDDEGVVIKKKQSGVQIGGGKMVDNHLYVLEYFKPGGLFAVSPTPDFKIFGTSVSRSASEVSTEDDGAVAEPSGPEGEVAKPRKRQPNKRLFGPEWSN